MKLSARFKQGLLEVRRYVVDWTLQMSPGEVIVTAVPTISSPSGGTGLVVGSLAIASNGLTAAFYVSGGQDGQFYEIDILSTTSIGQTFEDVVGVDVSTKV
jgi:hypothetical protein